MLAASVLGLLLVLAFLAGAGNAVYHPCGTALAAERFPNIRPYAISLHGMMGNIGTSVIPILQTFIAQRAGWRWSVAVCTLPVLILAVMYALSGMASKSSIGFLALLATRRFGFSVATVGLVISMYYGAGIAANPISLTAAADLADSRFLAFSVGLIYSLHGAGFLGPLVGGWLAGWLRCSACPPPMCSLRRSSSAQRC
jgi:hypothetical protein